MPDSHLLAATASLLALHVHPAAAGPEGLTVSAGIQIVDDAVGPGWWLHYRIEGPVDALTIPAPQTPGPADGLWRHTCFEAFVQDGDGPGYREFNLSPSGLWAVYRFATERARVAGDTPQVIGPSIEVHTKAEVLQLRAWIPRSLLPTAPGRVGLTAVIESTAGQLSYWALRHPHADRPDFHHPDGRSLAPA